MQQQAQVRQPIRRVGSPDKGEQLLDGRSPLIMTIARMGNATFAHEKFVVIDMCYRTAQFDILLAAFSAQELTIV